MRVHHANKAFEPEDSGEEKSNGGSVTLKSVVTVGEEKWRREEEDDDLGIEGDDPRRSNRDSSSGVSSDLDEEVNVAENGGRETIAVIGSGDFGRALSARLVQAGYNVIIGSRDPQKKA